jgi:hypothetical protein
LIIFAHSVIIYLEVNMTDQEIKRVAYLTPEDNKLLEDLQTELTEAFKKFIGARVYLDMASVAVRNASKTMSNRTIMEILAEIPNGLDYYEILESLGNIEKYSRNIRSAILLLEKLQIKEHTKSPAINDILNEKYN